MTDVSNFVAVLANNKAYDYGISMHGKKSKCEVPNWNSWIDHDFLICNIEKKSHWRKVKFWVPLLQNILICLNWPLCWIQKSKLDSRFWYHFISVSVDMKKLIGWLQSGARIDSIAPTLKTFNNATMVDEQAGPSLYIYNNTGSSFNCVEMVVYCII